MPLQRGKVHIAIRMIFGYTTKKVKSIKILQIRMFAVS